MPARQPDLTLDRASALIRERATAPAGPALCGIESEWLTAPIGEPTRPVDFDRLRRAVETGPLPHRSRTTFEPGGQVELSSLPTESPYDAVRAMRADATTLRIRAADAGCSLEGLGFDWRRPQRRVLTEPRYAAMEAFFEGGGPHGRRMMCSTASVQVNIGYGGDWVSRWRLVHALGPVLAAAFANSPLCGTGLPSGWQSARLATWWCMDPTRTAPVPYGDGADPLRAWTEYVLSAHVMLITDGDRCASVAERLPLRDWITHGHPMGRPTAADLDYHLTTLFPPVRPRGWFELRMIDALPEPWWPVPLLVVDAICTDARAAAAAAEACRPVAGAWVTASRAGLADPHLGEAAAEVLTLAVESMTRAAAPADLLRLVTRFAQTYTLAGRSPADDRLAEWMAAGGSSSVITLHEEPSWA